MWTSWKTVFHRFTLFKFLRLIILRTCFRGPRRRNWKWTSLIILSSPKIPLFIRLKASCERKISLWRSNNPLLTHVKMVIRKASRRLRTRPSTVSDGLALEMDLTKNVTNESKEYWYIWSIRHLIRSVVSITEVGKEVVHQWSSVMKPVERSGTAQGKKYNIYLYRLQGYEGIVRAHI